ncbi:MAG: hypothetical protein RI989_1411 [Bacteroidota bacterium]
MSKLKSLVITKDCQRRTVLLFKNWKKERFFSVTQKTKNKIELNSIKPRIFGVFLLGLLRVERKKNSVSRNWID